MLASGTVIGNEWSIRRMVGEGACAKVYLVDAVGKALDFEVVLKVIGAGGGSKSKKDKEQARLCDTLYYEYVLYTGWFNEFPYRPRTPAKFGGLDEINNVRYLAMEKLDMDLVAMSKQSKPAVSKVGTIGKRILEGLMWMHIKTFLFIDVKPENFMLKGDEVYFVDFGLVERVSKNSTPGRQFAGTPAFCSVSSHKGNNPYYHDDVESMAYVLLSLFTDGQLPWSNAKSDDDCLKQKEAYDIETFARSHGCIELFQIIQDCRNGEKGKTPDYDKFQRLFDAMKQRKSISTSTASTTTAKATSSRAKPSSVGTATAIPPVPVEEETKPKSRGKSLKVDVDIIEFMNKPTVIVVDTPPVSMSIPVSAVTSKTKTKTTTTNKRAASSSSIIEPLLQQPTLADLHLNSTKTLPNPIVPLVDMVDDLTAEPPSYPHKKRSSEGPFTIVDVAIERKHTLRSSLSPHKENCKPMDIDNTIKVREARGKGKGITSAASAATATATGESSYVVNVLDGPHKNHQYPLVTQAKQKDGCVFVIGREEGNDVSLPSDESVSGKHLAIKVEADGIKIKDERSTNHVYVNNIQLPSNRWKLYTPGDIITLGDSKVCITKT